MSTPMWMTPKQVEAESGRNVWRVRVALRRGLLAGTQSHAKASWRVSRTAFNDWMERGAPVDRPTPRRIRRSA